MSTKHETDQPRAAAPSIDSSGLVDAEGSLTEDIINNYGAEFSEEDMDAIVHVEFLLTEYAWSEDDMEPAADRLRRDMKHLWASWSKKASTSEMAPHHRDRRGGQLLIEATERIRHLESVLSALMPFVLEDYYPECASPDYQNAVEEAKRATTEVRDRPDNGTPQH